MTNTPSVQPPRESSLRPIPRLVTIPRFSDPRGTLSVVDWPQIVAFTPRRFYYLYDLAPGTTRAGHAHFVEEELILCLHGSVVITADDGQTRRDFSLNRPDIGVYIPPLVWHELRDFAPGTVCAVLASKPYSETDYCRDYAEFLQIARPPGC